MTGVQTCALPIYHVDSAGMVFYKKPIANIFTFAINRQRFFVTNVIDEQRNQFFKIVSHKGAVNERFDEIEFSHEIS